MSNAEQDAMTPEVWEFEGDWYIHGHGCINTKEMAERLNALLAGEVPVEPRAVEIWRTVELFDGDEMLRDIAIDYIDALHASHRAQAAEIARLNAYIKHLRIVSP